MTARLRQTARLAGSSIRRLLQGSSPSGTSGSGAPINTSSVYYSSSSMQLKRAVNPAVGNQIGGVVELFGHRAHRGSVSPDVGELLARLVGEERGLGLVPDFNAAAHVTSSVSFHSVKAAGVSHSSHGDAATAAAHECKRAALHVPSLQVPFVDSSSSLRTSSCHAAFPSGSASLHASDAASTSLRCSRRASTSYSAACHDHHFHWKSHHAPSISWQERSSYGSCLWQATSSAVASMSTTWRAMATPCTGTQREVNSSIMGHGSHDESKSTAAAAGLSLLAATSAPERTATDVSRAAPTADGLLPEKKVRMKIEGQGHGGEHEREWGQGHGLEQRQPLAGGGVLYRGKWMRPLRLMVRLKVAQLVGVGAVAVPLAHYTQGGEISTVGMLALGGVVFGAAAASTALWFYSSRYIGELSIPALSTNNVSGTTRQEPIVRFSTLDFWGNREDLDVPLRDVIVPFENMSHGEIAKACLDTFIPLEVLGQRQFVLSIRHGIIKDKENLLSLLRGELSKKII